MCITKKEVVDDQTLNVTNMQVVSSLPIKKLVRLSFAYWNHKLT